MSSCAKRWPVPPSWLEEKRKDALEAYEREPVPTWRRSGFWTTTLRKLDLDALGPRHHEPAAELPELVREDIGDAPLAGLVVQRGASTIHSELDPALAEQGVIVTSLEQAAEEQPDLVQEWYMRRLSHDEGKFPAASAALWTGGAFIHVPKDVQVEHPIQVVYLIDEPGTAQYAHTLAVVGENAECMIRE